jgi:hypothetical protein
MYWTPLTEYDIARVPSNLVNSRFGAELG